MGWNLRGLLIPYLLLTLLAAGCGKSSPNRTQVQGTVFYRGVPLQGGTIVFIPDPSKGGSGPIAHAEIRPGGSYVLRSEEGLYVQPGWHRVTIAAGTPSPSLPARYCDPELSGLEREVKPDTVNVIDLRLE